MIQERLCFVIAFLTILSSSSPYTYSLIPLEYLLLQSRWQVAPLFFGTVLVTLSKLVSFESLFMTSIGIILLLATVVLDHVFPLFKIPPPSGQYKVGTRFTCWYDKKRDKKISVQIWYPSEATPTEKPTVFWWPNTKLMTPKLCELFHFPNFVLNHLNLCYSNSYLNIEPLNQSLPVIISSHGFSGFKGDRSFFCENFASNGYLVLAIDHPGDCAMCVFPDGSCLPFTAYLKPGDDEWQIRHDHIKHRVDDLQFFITQLQNIRSSRNPDGSVEKYLCDFADLNQVGLFGHSYGAATCLTFLQTYPDSIVKNCVGLDPWVFPLDESSEKGSPVPLMFISADGWAPGIKHQARRKIIVENSKSPSHGFIIHDTNHHNFDDLPLLVPSYVARKIGFIGKIDPQQCFEISAEYSLFFYDTHLRRIKASTFPQYPHIYKETEANN